MKLDYYVTNVQAQPEQDTAVVSLTQAPEKKQDVTAAGIEIDPGMITRGRRDTQSFNLTLPVSDARKFDVGALYVVTVEAKK
jgi:hypothetical protein